MTKSIIDASKDMFQAYFTGNAEFIAMVGKRTAGELAYDNEVVAGLKNGLSIEQALKAATEKNPDEALQWNNDTIEGIRDHYLFLKGHEEILSLYERALLQEKQEVDLLAEKSFLLSEIKQLERTAGKVGRNEPCPCGSGKKFKKCCGR